MSHLPLKSALAAAAVSLILAGCATSTPYQPAGYNGQRGGYAEQRVDQNRYRVSFAGNSVTSREQVEMSLLYRAAELTAQSGYDWFTTVNRATDRDVRYVQDYDPYYASRYGWGWGPTWRYSRRGTWSSWGYGWPGRYGLNDYQVREIDRFEASAEILMGRGAKPADDANAFDAREVMANLGPRVVRPM
jgi:hypothetical protein